MPTYRTANNQFCIQQFEYDSGAARNAANAVHGSMVAPASVQVEIPTGGQYAIPSPYLPISEKPEVASIAALAELGMRNSFGDPLLSLSVDQFADSFGGGIATQFAIVINDGFVCAAMDLVNNEFNPCLLLMPVTLTLDQAEALMRAALAEAFLRWPTLRDGNVIGSCQPGDSAGIAALNFYASRWPQITQTTDPNGQVTNRWTARQAAAAYALEVP